MRHPTIKERREALGISQEQLAAAARVSVRALCAIERGETKTPRRVTLLAVTAALDAAERAVARTGER